MLTPPSLVLIAPMSSTWKILGILSALYLDRIYFGPSCFPFNCATVVWGQVPVALSAGWW